MYEIKYDTDWLVAEPETKHWDKNDYIFQDETKKIIGLCMEVHQNLGFGFLEIVYKDAIEYELRKKLIPYEREKLFRVLYKDIVLPHSFYADYFAFGKIILEVKAQKGFAEENYAQVINYLAASGSSVGLLINFGESSLRFKRFAFTPKQK
jgi:GxxExxY protein